MKHTILSLTMFTLYLQGSFISTAFGDNAPTWRAISGSSNGANAEVRALLVTSGSEAGSVGNAPALWIAGDFTSIGGMPVRRAASFHAGASGQWLDRGSDAFEFGLNTLAEHDAGPGGGGNRVYVGGFLEMPVPNNVPDCVASFDGSTWQGLTIPGYALTWCNALVSFQLPNQPRKLLVSGSPSGDPSYVKAMSNNTWELAGSEFITVLDAAMIHDDGSGPELFTANGTFEGANKWNGSRQAALGGSCFNSPRCFAAWKPEGVTEPTPLYMGGNLARTAQVPVSGVAKWNGTTWTALGGTNAGVRRNTTAPGWVHAMVPFDDGHGEKLWMVGLFSSVVSANGTFPAQNIAAWDGTSWFVPASGLSGVPNDGSFFNGVLCAAVYDFDGPGGRPPSLVVAGKFTHAGGIPASNIAVLDAAWCGPADVGRQGGISKPDGRLDNNDFVAFVDLFFAAHPAADLGIQGGVPGRDALFDNNDFVIFIDAFFVGC